MKTKFPRAVAQEALEDIEIRLAMFTEQFIAAGSFRRRRQEVGDLEILYVPKLIPVASVDLFERKEVNAAELAIEEMLARGVLKKRLNVQGRSAWGAQNKLAVFVASGLPVDLFATTKEAWNNYLVCRTGPAELNILIAQRAKRNGWKWNPYGVGFQCLTKAKRRAVQSEREVFEFVQLPYIEPADRTLEYVKKYSV